MRINVKLVGEGGVFYTTSKNKKNTPEKLELRKYNKKTRKREVYKEEKLK